MNTFRGMFISTTKKRTIFIIIFFFFFFCGELAKTKNPPINKDKPQNSLAAKILQGKLAQFGKPKHQQ